MLSRHCGLQRRHCAVESTAVAGVDGDSLPRPTGETAVSRGVASTPPTVGGVDEYAGAAVGTERVITLDSGLRLHAVEWSAAARRCTRPPRSATGGAGAAAAGAESDGCDDSHSAPGSAVQHRVLALHGWLDNAASMSYLGPRIATALNAQVVALDFAGHGRSDRRSADGYYINATQVADMVDCVHALGWDDGPQFSIVGHSMGAGVGGLLAGVLPHRVRCLVQIEAHGVYTRPASDMPTAILDSVLAYRALRHKTRPRRYASLEAAARERCERAAARGEPISLEASLTISRRGAREAPGGGGGVCFTHDPRLSAPSLHYMTEEQVRALLRAYRGPALLVEASEGLQFPGESKERRTMKELDLSVVQLAGGHHLHIDPDTRAATARVVLDFMRRHL